MNILILTKRQYTNKDLLDDRFGRIWNLPFELSLLKHNVNGLCLSYQTKTEITIFDGTMKWESINAGRLKFLGLFRFLRRAVTLARKSDIIWACSDSIYGIIGYFLAKTYHKPLIFDLYDNFEYFLLGRIPVLKQIYRWIVKNCDGVTCVSKPLAGLVKSYGRKKALAVIENTAQANLFMPLPKKFCRDELDLPRHALLVGTAGALFQNRGITTLFDAFDHLENKIPNLYLVVAGPRDVKIPKKTKIIDMQVLDHEKIPMFFNALDVAIVCNLKNDFGRYCFPQKAREIMVCDVPLIGAQVGGMCDLLAENPEWLFKPGNKYNLANSLENRLNDLRTGYKNIKSWKDIAIELEKFFLKILKTDKKA